MLIYWLEIWLSNNKKRQQNQHYVKKEFTKTSAKLVF